MRASIPYEEVKARALARPGVRFWYTVYGPWYWARRLIIQMRIARGLIIKSGPKCE